MLQEVARARELGSPPVTTTRSFFCAARPSGRLEPATCCKTPAAVGFVVGAMPRPFGAARQRTPSPVLTLGYDPGRPGR